MGASSCKLVKLNSEHELQEDEKYQSRVIDRISIIKRDNFFNCPKSRRVVSLSDISFPNISKKRYFEQTCTFVDVNEFWSESKLKLFFDDAPTFQKQQCSSARHNWNDSSTVIFKSNKIVKFDSSNPDKFIFQSENINSPCSSNCSDIVSTPTYTPNRITEVIPGKLYLGCEDKAGNERELLSIGITHILSVNRRVSEIKGIEYEQFVMNDRGRTELNKGLEKVYAFMERAQQAKNKLFVHCRLGQNRSPTIVLSFLMKSKGLTLYESHKMLKEMRPVVQIHPSYAKMLLKLETDLFGETSLPDDWMELDRENIENGIPVFKSEEMTVEEQRMFKLNQNLERSACLIVRP